MTESYTIAGSSVSLVRGGDFERGDIELVEHADHGNIGSGRILLDDTAGTLDVVGHKPVVILQNQCSVTHLFRGYVAKRSYKRGIEQVGASRIIDVALLDLNARLHFKVLRGTTWKRSAETISARLTALLAASQLSSLVADRGFVDYPTDSLDKNDYRGQFPDDVLRDMALVAGYNYFVYWDESTASAGLWFRDSNDSTAFSSTLRISNVKSDVDDSTTFASNDEELGRDPSEVVSGVYMPFQRGNVYRTRALTENTFQARDGVAPSSDVKTRDKARTRADDYLFRRRNEEDLITDEIILPNNKVNLVRAGQRIQAKYQHFGTEGYGAFTWFRILETKKRPLDPNGTSYRVGLTLSPQECSATEGDVSMVQYAIKHAWGGAGTTITLDHAVGSASGGSAGDLLVMAVGNRDEITAGPLGAPISGWTQVPIVSSYCFIENCVEAVGAPQHLAHGAIWYREAQTGDQTFTGLDNSSAAIVAQFSGPGTTAITSAKAENCGITGAAVNFSSGDPGVGSLVVSVLITRLTDTGLFTPSGSTNKIPPAPNLPPQTTVQGGGTPILLWGVSTDGSAFNFTGTLSGDQHSGDSGYHHGYRCAAFGICST